MTVTGKAPVIEHELRIGQEMNFITFADLVKEMTGEPFDIVYKGYLSQEESNEQGNME